MGRETTFVSIFIMLLLTIFLVPVSCRAEYRLPVFVIGH